MYNVCVYIRMQRDFVYRSANSELSAATDVVFVSETEMGVSYMNGVFEIVDIDTRKCIQTHKFEHPVTGLAYHDGLIVVQLKSHTVECYQICDGWTLKWSFPCELAVTFSKPIIRNIHATPVCYFVESSSKLVCVELNSGRMHKIFQTPQNVKGINLAMCHTDKGIAILYESNQVVHINDDGNLHVETALLSSTLSCVPTAIQSVNGTIWVGYSEGKVVELSGIAVCSIEETGIGAIAKNGLIGCWDGTLHQPETLSPHLGSAIRQISVSSNYVAVASSDGRVSTFLMPS